MTFSRMYNHYLKAVFEEKVVEQQHLFRNKEHLETILTTFIPEDKRGNFRQYWETKSQDSIQRWLDFEKTLKVLLLGGVTAWTTNVYVSSQPTGRRRAIQ